MNFFPLRTDCFGGQNTNPSIHDHLFNLSTDSLAKLNYQQYSNKKASPTKQDTVKDKNR